ncbi:ribulokinase [candidate division KSB1 bacterium]|nr:ribulokinase [candidate division KSB1 bacterium]
MAKVAGVDFGTQSVRVSVFDHEQGRLASASESFELIRKSSDPDWATQRPIDQIEALEKAFKKAIESAGVEGEDILALAIDTTGSTVVPVDSSLKPLDDYYMWCDHRAKKEAAEITAKAHELKLENIQWCGGVYSSEWGLAKVLHWLRYNPNKREKFYSAFENCDLVAAMLCGIKEADQVKRSSCAAGHKWMVHEHLGGLPAESFLKAVDPLLGKVRDQLSGYYATSFELAGFLSPEWAHKLGLKPGIPIPVGALDAHWDAIGAGIREGDVVNVVGTSTCIMAIGKDVQVIPGVSGVVNGSIHPEYWGIEAGLSAVGDVFDAIAKRSGKDLAALSESLKEYRAGQTGLLRLCWDNGDRNILVNPELGGMTLGLTLTSTAQDELFAAIEGTAMHTNIIFRQMEKYGVPIERVINGGGIPQRNPVLNQVYANILDKKVLVPESDVTSLGSAIFAFLAANVFDSIENAQENLCPDYKVYEPDPKAAETYKELQTLFDEVYFSFGDQGWNPKNLAHVLPRLRHIAQDARQA